MKRKHIHLAGVLGALLGFATATAGTVGSPIDGQWSATITQAQLRRVHEKPARIPKLWGPYTQRLENGHMELRNLRTGGVARGTFTIHGRVVRFVYARGVFIRPPNNVAVCTWSIYRDRLTFQRIPGRPYLDCDAAVWTRRR